MDLVQTSISAFDTESASEQLMYFSKLLFLLPQKDRDSNFSLLGLRGLERISIRKLEQCQAHIRPSVDDDVTILVTTIHAFRGPMEEHFPNAWQLVF